MGEHKESISENFSSLSFLQKEILNSLPFKNLPKTEWDDKPFYFQYHPGGEYSSKEIQKITKTIVLSDKKTKVTLLEDSGLFFYRVEKGDTLEKIKSKLSELPQFSYLRNISLSDKLNSFNIPAKKLQIGLFIPIPIEQKDRILSDEQFTNYAFIALQSLKKHKRYGKSILKIIQSSSEKEVLGLMVAVAKQESGGKPLGQFEFHRWESAHNCFSFSIYHILLKGAGELARKNLGLTPGQTYHPINASKLFLAFLVEKGFSDNPDLYFPISQKTNGVPRSHNFSYLYNGAHWKKFNPHYAENLEDYYNFVLTKISRPALSGKKLKDSPFLVSSLPGRPEKFVLCHNRNIEEIIRKANQENSLVFGFDILGNRLSSFIQEVKDSLVPSPDDKLAVGYDRANDRIYVVFFDSRTQKFLFFSQNLSQEQKEKGSDFPFYTIRAGETLHLLAERLSADPTKSSDTLKKIQKLNPHIIPEKIRIGESLRVPADRIIVPDKPISFVLDKYYWGWKDKEAAKRTLKALNGLNPDTDIIRPGMNILVPKI